MLVGAAALAVLFALYAAFEFGRYDAGFRLFDSMRGALSTARRLRELEAENAAQHTQLEAAEVARRVDREGYKQVERSLGDMESQIGRLKQDLSFYRGLVQPDSVVHVRVQQMQIVPEAAGAFRLKFVLVQSGKTSGNAAGGLSLTLDGLRQGRPLSLSFAQVSPKARAVLAYSFRYFQEYDEQIRLPAGFEPTRVGVEIHAGRDTDHGFRQAFVWKAQGMSVETEAKPGADFKGPLDVQAETTE